MPTTPASISRWSAAGPWWRKARCIAGAEKRRARDALEEASTIFHALGARLWPRRARAELTRIGLRPPSPHELSQTETEVARLAANGMTNRQIASALFLSPRSVDGVIARIYQKLDIRSRAELGSRMALGRSA